MNNLEPLICSNCGAPIHKGSQAGEYKCTGCGTAYRDKSQINDQVTLSNNTGSLQVIVITPQGENVEVKMPDPEDVIVNEINGCITQSMIMAGIFIATLICVAVIILAF